MAKVEVTVRRPTSLAAFAGMGVIAILAVAATNSARSSPGRGSTVATLKVVTTLRSVTVSPAKTTFTDCSGGHYPFASTSKAMGYPHASCSIGKPGKTWPITITNGVRARILVRSSSAIPADGGTPWQLCNLGPHPVVPCEGRAGLPGLDQFVVENFSNHGKNTAGLTSRRHCDTEFDPVGACLALSGQSQREGVELIGPSTPDDTSLTWTVTITWTAVPP